MAPAWDWEKVGAAPAVQISKTIEKTKKPTKTEPPAPGVAKTIEKNKKN